MTRARGGAPNVRPRSWRARPCRRLAGWLCSLFVMWGAFPLEGQTPSSDEAAATITPAAMASYLRILTADSFQHRGTPSQGLERMARYVAAEFQRLGLQPGMRDLDVATAWFQRYPIPGQQAMDTMSAAVLQIRPRRHGKPIVVEGEADTPGSPLARDVWLRFGQDLYLAPEVGRQVVARHIWSFGMDPFFIGKPLLVVSGRQSAASIEHAAASLRGSVALYVPTAGGDAAAREQVLAALYRVGGRVLVLGDDDSTRFAASARAARQTAAVIEDHLRYATGARIWPWAAWVRTASLRGALEVAAGLDLEWLRRDTTPAMREVATMSILLRPARTDLPPDAPTAPNVLGVVPGTDPRLKDQYLVVSAHMDNASRADGALFDAFRTDAADSATAALRADDNVAGVAALLALARAFRQPGMAPRRSVLFLATSGGARELWGAHRYAYAGIGTEARREHVVANLNVDHLAHAAGDTLFVDGLQEVELPLSPAWAASIHPELALTVADGGTAIRPTSDHFAFVREAIPSLSFHAASSAGLGPAAPTAAIDSTRLAHVARLIFYVGEQVVNALRPPQWSVASRQYLADLLYDP